MSRRRCGGLTLVEVLVILAIVAVLVGLAMPALQAARVSAQRTHCIANQRQLAAASLEYLTSQGHFPGYRQLLAWRSVRLDPLTGEALPAGLHTPTPTAASWAVVLLPYLGREDLCWAHGEYGPDAIPGGTRGVPINTHVEIFVCPSDLRASVASPFAPRTANSYVANCGVYDTTKYGFQERRPDLPANGIFHDHFAYGANGARLGSEMTVTVTETFVRRGDGMSATLLFSENVDSSNWGDIHQLEIRLGMLWWPNVEMIGGRPQAVPPPTKAGIPVAGINQSPGGVEPLHVEDPDRRYFARPSSFHPGGVVAAFCDGHTQFLSDEMDYLVYCLLMTPDGRRAADPGTRQPYHELFTRTPVSPGDY